jgi:uncharacterized membrane protein
VLSRRKRAFIHEKTSLQLHWTPTLLTGLILLMGVIVIYDSYVHYTPLYYILFFFLGRVFGLLYRLLLRIQKKEDDTLKIQFDYWNIVLTAILVLLHFYLGEEQLGNLNVTWTKDALYLFFIGVYLTKFRIIIDRLNKFFIPYWLGKPEL